MCGDREGKKKKRKNDTKELEKERKRAKQLVNLELG